MDAELLPCGERAVIVELDDLDAVLALRDAVQREVDAARARLAVDRAADQDPEEPTPLLPPDPTHPDARPVTLPPGEADAGAAPEPHTSPGPAAAPGGGRHELRHEARHEGRHGGRDEQETRAWASVLDVVPAARTLMLMVIDFDALPPVRRLVSALAESIDTRASAPPHDVVTIPVVYDGPDLAEIAALTGLSADEVVAAHTGPTWQVAFSGFAPGFAYLVGGDGRLDVPRRSEPRTRVPAGAVGLAGEFSGIYPRSSPGGWQLLGHTDAVLWDEHREPPALLRPGMGVRFEAVDAVGPDDPAPDDPALDDPELDDPELDDAAPDAAGPAGADETDPTREEGRS